MARLRTSGRVSPSATQSLRKPSSPRLRTSARQVSSRLWPSFGGGPPNQLMARCRGSKNGQLRKSVTVELRRPLRRERLIGALEILALHQRRLRFGFHVERDFHRLRPFGVELALGDRMRARRAVGELAGESLRFGLDVVADTAEEAPGEAL